MASNDGNFFFIDRTGDVLLTLNNPGAPFAAWQPRDEDSSSDDTVQSGADNDMLAEESHSVRRNGTSQDESGADSESNNADTRLPQGSPQSAPKVYLVSSRHLINASAKFRSELTGSWSESLRDEDGMYHLTTCDWDADAFAILLNIYHLQYRQVPRELGLEMLAKMAVLVDYYRCWEAFDLIAPLWVQAAITASPLSEKYERDTMLWMVVSWVFKLPEKFQETTSIVINRNEESDVRDMELGIPPPILDELRTRRAQTIKKALETCHQCMNEWADDYHCAKGVRNSFACGSILLGALMKGLHRLKLLSPPPSAPFPGWSIVSICQNLAQIPSATWYDRGNSSRRHDCTLENTLHPKIALILSQVKGLILEDFRDRGEEEVDQVTRAVGAL
ncbi:hypothetical protein CC86DRAFT_311913 [Ophiobolus disseminans]|uniref:BTB domain-containing protein n=1 Tax=Ophiobolus disseminans TaxID=1469910 RepID=A0A6A7AKX4_9PLEO|nr:hypothetical protein CC86DRAFT_311913 [Ophiobolus disseminans]